LTEPERTDRFSQAAALSQESAVVHFSHISRGVLPISPTRDGFLPGGRTGLLRRKGAMDRVPMTKAGFETLKKELHRLKSVERPKNVKDIEEALAHGDLSENAEYHAAKERQGQLEAQMALLDDKIARAQVIDPSTQQGDQIFFGATVMLADVATDEEVTYTIVGEDEADATSGRISVTSPVARAMMGKRVDDAVTVRVPKGTREFEILEIRYE